MAESNLNIIQKADAEVADLVSNGGYLPDEVASSFITDYIKESVVLKSVTVKPMMSHTTVLPKVGISGRVLRPAQSGRALTLTERVEPTTEQVTIETKLMKAEIRLTDEYLEDNIEGGSFKNTIMSMFSEHIALDSDELAVNGSTGSADAFLAQFNGMLALTSSHTVNGGTVPIHKGVLKSAVKAMPSQYNRLRNKQEFWTSEDAEIDYRDYLADRATVLGDRFLESMDALRYGGRPIMPIPVFPDNLNGGSCTNIIYTHPKNFIWGVWRKIKINTDYDVQTGEWIAVATLRVGCNWQEEDAVVKVTHVRTA
jgi:hypothetical protein